MTPISSREYAFQQWYADKEKDYGISTITNRPAPTPEEEFSSRAGLMSSLAEMAGALENGNLGPEWKIGYIQPFSIAEKIPQAIREAAAASRRVVYQNIKKDVQDVIKNPKKYEKFLERIGITESQATKRALEDYKERVKAVTAIPDGIISRVRGWDSPTKGNAGTWAELRTPTLATDKGGLLNVLEKSPDQATTILHEGGHMSHGAAIRMFEAAKTNKEAKKLWDAIPKTSKETIENLANIDKFSRKWWQDAGARGRARLTEYYQEWPSEILSNEIPGIVSGLASKLGRRPTTDEYFKAIGPAAKRVQQQVKYLGEKFTEQDEIIKRAMSR